MHKATVRRWISQGMATIDKRRPLLLLGREATRFLDPGAFEMARQAICQRLCQVGRYERNDGKRPFFHDLPCSALAKMADHISVSGLSTPPISAKAHKYQ